ncbi:hypothetical protein ACFQVC_02185 [Streptomyces monticola]|uniref:Mce-associated membrane protein n=1 Tax=Streptomyces monticola TaxID=2666263 RepID=A0ABW2JB26_9ACTN
MASVQEQLTPDAADAPAGSGQHRVPRGRRRTTLVLTVGLTVALLLAAAGLGLRTWQLRTEPATGNRALTDAAATEQVAVAVGDALTRVFSYTPENTEATRQAAAELLAGKAATQYEALFGQVAERAGEQRLTLTSHVVRTGVTRLTGREARLLVFLDQVAERKGGKPAEAAAQLSVTARLQGGTWRITELKSR